MHKQIQRGLTAAAVSLASAGLFGCADDQAADNEVPGQLLNVYVSVPLEGVRGSDGAAIVNGAKLALADAGGKAGKYEVHAVFLDDTAGRPARWSPVASADNARRAAQDTAAIAYIGELDSGATRISLPISNQARILQVTPGATAVDLTKAGPGVDRGEPERFYPSGERTFGRVVPADDVQARAAARWAKSDFRAKRVYAISDGSDFGDGLVADFRAEARRLGLGPSTNLGDVGPADVIYFGGTSEARNVAAIRRLSAVKAALITSDAQMEAGFLRRLGSLAEHVRSTSPFVPAGANGERTGRFVREYGRQFGSHARPVAAYGYEAMALVLDSIRRADNGRDRTKVAKAFLATRMRRSILGTYSIDPDTGDTTLGRIAGYRISRGKPVFERLLSVPAG